MKSLGEELLHFAQSADFLTDDNVKEIKKLVFGYLIEKAGAATVEVCVRSSFEHKPSLEYVWFSENDKPESHHVKDDTGEYYGQTSYAFDKNVRLWIVAKKDEQVLHTATEFFDLWSDEQIPDPKIPRFIAYAGANKNKIRTSVILPLIKHGKPRGVFNIEFGSRVRRFPALEHEIDTIKQAIEILIDLEAFSKLNRANTETAIKRIEHLAKSAPCVRSPSIFFAYPDGGDPNVIGSIERVLADFFSSDQIVDWKRIDDSGNINRQILEKMSAARYGICYFSEPGANGYVDNANVLFEAGMLHGRTSDLLTPSNWIPIREKAAHTPFDFAAERMIVVPRNGNKLNTHVFENELRLKLAATTSLPSKRTDG